MKKLINELMRLCPGRLYITLDYHKVFNQTAEQTLHQKEYLEIDAERRKVMEHFDTIIKVEAYPLDKPTTVVTYHYDLELALKETLKNIKEWKVQ